MSGEGVYLSTTSGSDGSYTFSAVFPQGGYQMSTTLPGYFPKEVLNISVAPNGTVTQDITLQGFTPGSLIGKVYDQDGYPVSSVSIYVDGIDVNYDLSSTSDSFGDYRFDLLQTGTFQLNLSKSGYQYTTISPVSVAAGNTTVRDVTMEEPAGSGSISGTVFDASGNPTAGVRVQVSSPTYRQVTTRLDGTYRLNGLNPGTYSVMLPNEEGDPTQGNIQVMADQNTPNVNFNLDFTYGTISGTIRNRMAQPLPGANVRADAVGHSFYPDSVTSGSSGLYIMTRVNNGGGKDYRVYANRDGFVKTFYADSLTSSGATTVTIPDGDSVEDIDIVLGPGAIVSGSVVDGDTSLPISSGSVVFNRGDLSEYISINNGSYRTNILPPGEFRVSTSISGYSTEYYDNVGYQNDATVLTIAEGETIDGIDFTPSRSASISGMVVDESGTAYTSGSVRAYEISRSPSEYTSANLSGGEYTLSNLVAGQYYVFVLISGKPSVFYPSAFSAGDAQTVSVSGGQARMGIDITVPSSIENGSISGTVLSRFGTVDSSIRVRVIGVDGTSYNNTSNLDENGNYLAENLLPGTYIVGLVDGIYPVYYYGGVYSMDSATRVTVAPGQDRTGIDIMATEFPQATLTGIVQTQGGTPIPGAEVRLEMGSITYNTTSGSDGSYVFKNILPGADYEIRAGARGYYDSPLEPIVLIENQTSNYNLTLDPYEMTSVMGHVENASGYPLNNANLNLYGDNLSSSRYLNTDDFGNYLFDNLPPGNYSIGVSSSGYTSQNVGGIGTTPGSPTIRNFVLEYDPNNGVVEGTVTDSEGNPAYGILVRSSNSRSTTTQLDGTYQLTNLSAGTYSISLPNENDSGNPMMENVIVVADETTSGIDFTLTVAYGTISGTVMDTVGTPISDANVDPDPIDHDFYPSNVYSGFDGNFIIGRLRTDGGRDYRFAASKDGYVKTYYEDAIDQNLATVIHLNQGDSFSPAPIQLQTAARISGKVSEEGTGRLINTGGVRAQLPDGSQSFYASLDNTGGYLFDELPGGDYQVYTSISNYVTEYYQESANRDDADILTVASGDIVEGIDLTPARAGGISGTVLDASGNAIASGTVYTYPVGGTTSDQSSRSIGNSGEFAFTNVAPGQHYVYAVVSGKPSVFFGNTFFQDVATPVMVSGGLVATGTNITVPNEFQNGSISGSVTNLFGEPYPNLNMTISGVDGTSNNVNPRTDSEGNYSGTSLLPGLYTVAIRESGRPNYYYGKTYDQDMATRVKVEEGMETPNIDIMAPQRNDGSVRGLVKNLSGQLLNGVQVQLQGNSVYQSDTTGPDGLFLFPFVPGGDYELTATAPGYLSAEADVTVQSGRLNAGTIITMEAFTGGAIAGMVTDVSGNPLEDANVNISHSQYGYLGNAQTTRYGDYYYDNLPPGTYSLSSSSSGYDSENRSNVSIPEGGMANEDFALAARSNVGRVSGTVIGANGRGVYRIQVRSEGPSSRTTYTYPDGTYILSNLSAGTYRIYLQNETGPTIENLNVQVTNGETTGGVDFALDQSYGAVSGTVFEKGAVNPVRKGSVRGDVFETGGYIDEADIGSQGNYIIGRVPIDATGGVRARATADGYASVYWMDSPILETANAVTLDASGDAGGIDFGLDFEASLFGRITDFFGTPIKNSNANATLLEASGGISFSDSVNANGWYEIPQLPGGDYRLRFSASYFTTQYYNGVPDLASAELITLPIGGSEQFDAVLNPNTAIGGIVTDASGNPVTNAFVDLYRVGDLNPSRLYVNGNGQYSFQGIAPGDYRLRAYSPDYAPRWWLGQTSATSATLLTLESNEVRGGIDFVFSSRSSNVYDLIADGTIDAFDLIELLGLGTDSASTFFDFSQYWMSTTSKSFRVENE
ncbi:MAG: carboxypeptidase regulatory-like domain-containing protein [Candidatus Omnitrophica bacterium]|nr:carboxypeptidase regulatory-like domain-containing protein [Candidatus Omnitrophota bacterium]